jgi:hypothetical protein
MRDVGGPMGQREQGENDSDRKEGRKEGRKERKKERKKQGTSLKWAIRNQICVFKTVTGKKAFRGLSSVL